MMLDPHALSAWAGGDAALMEVLPKDRPWQIPAIVLGDICRLKACLEVGHRLLYARVSNGENPVSFRFSVNPEGVNTLWDTL